MFGYCCCVPYLSLLALPVVGLVPFVVLFAVIDTALLDPTVLLAVDCRFAILH